MHDRVFVTTLGASILIHLSMITLFSIYVLIPVKRPVYYQFDIVDPVTHESVIRAPLDSLRIPSFDEAMRVDDSAPTSALPGQDLTLNAPPELTGMLPEITLPSLDLAQLERSEMIVSSLRTRTQFETGKPRDAWGRFLSGVGKLDDRLRALTPFDAVIPGGDEKSSPVPVSRPAEGLAMYVEWVGEPAERALLFAAPIDSLWRVEPETLREPIAIPFKVNANGEVVLMLAPPAAEGDISADIGVALEKFRFEPLPISNSRDQYGTLIVAQDTSE